jgi:hypothetical protein
MIHFPMVVGRECLRRAKARRLHASVRVTIGQQSVNSVFHWSIHSRLAELTCRRQIARLLGYLTIKIEGRRFIGK